ncbi:MAG: exodeoxyribonuclease VII small subunit [Frankia sp.]
MDGSDALNAALSVATSSPATTGVKPGAQPAPATFEQARSELEEIVRRLEAGGISLEESVTLWERGEELARVCQAFLDGARKRLAATDPAAG